MDNYQDSTNSFEKSMITNEYMNFIKWFESSYPDLKEKYKNNIEAPFKLGNGVTITRDNLMTDKEYQRLLEISREYYKKKE